MIAEILVTFSQSCRLILQNPKLLVYSLIYMIITEVGTAFTQTLPLDGLMQCLSFFYGCLSLYVFVLIDNYYILYLYRDEGAKDANSSLFQDSRSFFWPSLFQFGFGGIFTALISIPIVFMVSILVRMFPSIQTPLVLLGWFLAGFLFLGAVSLGKRILLAREHGVVASVWYGLKTLSYYQGKYLLFYIFYIACVVIVFIGRGFLGAVFTDINIFSTPVIPLIPFLNTYSQATSYWIVRLIGDMVAVFSFPFLSFLITYSYLKNRQAEL